MPISRDDLTFTPGQHGWVIRRGRELIGWLTPFYSDGRTQWSVSTMLSWRPQVPPPPTQATSDAALDVWLAWIAEGEADGTAIMNPQMPPVKPSRYASSDESGESE